jgi:hypothetical protein
LLTQILAGFVLPTFPTHCNEDTPCMHDLASVGRVPASLGSCIFSL